MVPLWDGKVRFGNSRPSTCIKICFESETCRNFRERKGPLTEKEKLSIRGVEQKFLNSDVKSSDLL